MKQMHKVIQLHEVALIRAIVRRAAEVCDQLGHPPPDPLELFADLAACHAAICRLRLDELRQARVDHFAHDVFGIRDHLDRTAGRLRDGFTPRYAAPAEMSREPA